MMIEMIGWLGMLSIVAAYYLNSTGKLRAQDVVYQSMNLFGALAVGVNVFVKQSWPAVALEFVWAVIALTALLRIVRKAPPKT